MATSQNGTVTGALGSIIAITSMASAVVKGVSNMSSIVPARMTAQLDGDFVVFLIGMRINKWWKFWKWLPVARAMPRMLIELAKQPELGLLHARSVFGFPNVMVIQYWRSFEQLQTYATARSSE